MAAHYREGRNPREKGAADSQATHAQNNAGPVRVNLPNYIYIYILYDMLSLAVCIIIFAARPLTPRTFHPERVLRS